MDSYLLLGIHFKLSYYGGSQLTGRSKFATASPSQPRSIKTGRIYRIFEVDVLAFSFVFFVGVHEFVVDWVFTILN